jgi:hypothetical protein
MYLEILQQIYGSALEKRAAAPDESKSQWAAALEEMDSWWSPWKKQPYYPREGGSPYFVRKVTSPTGTVERYDGDPKGENYYKNMKPSNPGYKHNYNAIPPKNSPRYAAGNNIFKALLTKKQPSEEDVRIWREHTAKVKKLKRRSVPRHSYARY